MYQSALDDAARRAFPELARLIDLRESGDWLLDVTCDAHGGLRAVTGERVYRDGTTDMFGVLDVSEARAIRLTPLGQWVVKCEGTLIEIIDLLLDLPAPWDPLAPRRVLGGAMPTLLVP